MSDFPEADLSTRTYTVLFTDLADYTASVRKSDRQSIRAFITAHERLVAEVLASHGGMVVKNMGDSFMTLYDSATDAVRGGMALLASLRSKENFKIRVAIATGDIECISDDYFGDAVNLASRILSQTPVDELWFSESTLLSMNQSELAWEVAGVFHFKGFFGDLKVLRAIPEDRVWLPDRIEQAIELDDLVVFRPGHTIPRLRHDSVILLLDCPTGGEELDALLSQMPVLPASQVWLAGYDISPSDRWNWVQRGSGWVIGKSEAISENIQRLVEHNKLYSSSMTMILDAPRNVSAGLSLMGIALPRTPLSEVVMGYSYDLRADGQWLNYDTKAILRISVNPEGARLVALQMGILINGKVIQAGGTHILKDADLITSHSGEYRYVALDNSTYLGMLLGGTCPLLPIESDSLVEIGREPKIGGFSLNDRRGQKNLQWCSGSRAQKARMSGFTLDRALAGRRQAELTENNGTFTLRQLHEHCPTYVIEEGELQMVSGERELDYQELVVTGTSVLALQKPSD